MVDQASLNRLIALPFIERSAHGETHVARERVNCLRAIERKSSGNTMALNNDI